LEIWKKSAVAYFHEKLEATVIEKEYDKLSGGDYDYEPDYDY